MTNNVDNALVIIDMQNDTVLPSSPWKVDGAYETLPAVKRLLEWARGNNWAVFHIVREYRSDGVDIESSRIKDFEGKGGYLVPGTNGVEIVDELTPLQGEYRIVKQRFSAFMQTELDFILRRLGVTRIAICGTQYPNCICATAFDALSLDYDVSIVTPATSAQTKEIAKANIIDLENVGIRCVTFEALKESA